MASLVVSLGSLPVLALPLGDGTFRLGRDPSNDLVLSLPEVAGFHAEIDVQAGSASLRAAEGESILLNGRPTSRAPLTPGDQILLGGYRLCYRAGPGEGSDEAYVPTGGFSSTGPVSLDPAGPGTDRVRVVEGPDLGSERLLEPSALVVGRAPDCDLILDDETVSWRHVALEPATDGVRVRDLGSRNGTFLDGRKVESAVAPAGGRVRLGRTTLEICGAPAAEEEEPTGLAEMIGGSPAMREVFDRIREAAPGRMSVLLMGETGTGKELAARALHALGPRATAPFLPVNCAAIPRDLMEAELFGHVRGAFTGAAADRVGIFEAAAGGTVFLDEIVEMPVELQSKLLRVLEEGQVPRLGGAGVPSDFRIVAATNRDPATEIAAGRLREDLYYRLAVVPIRLPPLRDRREDLPLLVRHFRATAAESTGIPEAGRTRIDEGVVDALAAHPWPGNVRELRNLIVRAITRRAGRSVSRSLVRELLREAAPPPGAGAAPQSLEELEREAILNALRDCDGRRRAAARRLGIAESTLYEKIRRYDLKG